MSHLGLECEAGDVIAKSGNFGLSGNYHLHFASHDRDVMYQRKGYRNETLYRYAIIGPSSTGSNTDYWESGKHIDTFSWVSVNNSKSVSITISFSGQYNNDAEKPSEVLLYYRITNSGNWSGPVVMSNSGNANSFDYLFDFSTIPAQVPSGSTVQYLIRYKRSNNSQYMWAPAKFYQPNPNPNAVANPYGYFTINVLY